MSEFGGESGPHGIDIRKSDKNLSAADKLRLGYAVGTNDPTLPLDPAKHAWRGTDAKRYEKINNELGNDT